jgi:hypothetical protein
VLFISFGSPKNAEGVDIGEGTIIRIRPYSNEIVGITLLNPLHRNLLTLKKRNQLRSKKKISPIVK